MTTASPTLKLRSCPRCDGALKLCYDEFGGFWDCLSCGYNGHADVPPAPQIRRAEAMAAYQSVFDYVGLVAAFQGYRLRGRLLIAKRSETVPRFDLGCPYRGCSRRQLAAPKKDRRGGLWIYRCRNKHEIQIDLEELTWR